MVDYNLTEEQQALREVAARFFVEQSPMGEIRRLEGEGESFSRPLWEAMSSLDWIGLAIPEEHGGSGSGLVELAVIYHQMGRTLANTPHLASAVIAAEILAGDGSAAARALLPDIAAGKRIVVSALLEEHGLPGEDNINLPLTAEGHAIRVRGTKMLVPFAADASHFIVAGRGLENPDGISLVLVDAGSHGVELTSLPNLGGYPLYVVAFDTAVPGDSLIGAPGDGWPRLEAAHDRARVLRSAQIAGAGERLLELSVEYAKFREQFGNPIGKYQAVQYLCTDIAIDVELTQLHAISTAARADVGLPFALEASRTKAYASRAAKRIAQRAHEVFAGVAFMIESDIPLFSRRMKHWELDLGDERDHLATCGRLIAGGHAQRT